MPHPESHKTTMLDQILLWFPAFLINRHWGLWSSSVEPLDSHSFLQYLRRVHVDTVITVKSSQSAHAHSHVVLLFSPTATRSCLHVIGSQGETVHCILERSCIAAPGQCTHGWRPMKQKRITYLCVAIQYTVRQSKTQYVHKTSVVWEPL